MSPNDYYKRGYLFIILTVVIVGMYIIRLFYLQILTPNYKSRAESNAFYQKPIYPARGVIYDRNGELLVMNKPTFDLMVVTGEAGEFDSVALCKNLNIDITVLRQRFKDMSNRRKNPGFSRNVPQVLISQLSTEEAGRFQEILYKFPGFSIQSRTIRQYNYHHAAHILGYVSEANPSDISRDKALVAGDYTGRMGVERVYEKELRGVKGVEILLRDASGRIKGRSAEGRNDRAPVNGSDLTLSIDSKLQAFGEELMQGKRGAIVVIQPSTGEILAMVSAPSYDPEMLTGKKKGENHRILEDMPSKPLYARAIMGNYPPGSTFKPAQGAIYLQEGIITPQTSFACYHGYPLLRGRPRCHSHASPVSIVPALATSCNAFFCWGLHGMLDDRRYYRSPQEALEHWKNRIVKLGYGYPLGVDLYGEKRGYIPNSKVYDKIYKGRWNSSTIISISIGQGEILATPLQIANLAAIIANRGYYYKPHVVRGISGSKLDTLYTNKHNTEISSTNWEYIVSGMAAAVTGGTCRAANFAPGEIEVCGKTGTAENPHGKDHSAFIGFAPRNNPQIAVGVYVENGGFGAVYGVPIGRVMMEYYLRKGELSGASQAIAEKMKKTSVSYGDGDPSQSIYLEQKNKASTITVPLRADSANSQNDKPIQ